jgi:hypothetical protein
MIWTTMVLDTKVVPLISNGSGEGAAGLVTSKVS